MRAPGQRGMHGALHGPAGGALVDELHLGLGGMNIDIDRRRIEADVDSGQRVAPDQQQRVIRLLQGEAERPVLHPAAIDEDDDPLAVGAREFWRADPALHCNARHRG